MLDAKQKLQPRFVSRKMRFGPNVRPPSPVSNAESGHAHIRSRDDDEAIDQARMLKVTGRVLKRVLKRSRARGAGGRGGSAYSRACDAGSEALVAAFGDRRCRDPERLDIDDPAYFSRRFKQRTRRSPIEFRSVAIFNIRRVKAFLGRLI